MNKERRKKLEEAKVKIEQAMQIIDSVYEEEQESFDNLPEGLQYSEKGDDIQSNIDALESASNSCTDVIDFLDDALD